MKKTPKVGDDKFVITSRIEFEPVPPDWTNPPGTGELPDQIARILFKLILNTDVLPNSTMLIKLGGIYRDTDYTGGVESGAVRLSGANAPLFTNGEGMWDATT